ncbi:LamB/YcsF family protein [Botrimarina colliarenosi]|uniref:LamB/YcsF family protein n=1 Tax=Botrimarina colliarenosi TaxID=2528001 RepID=A0A5C6ALE2_9BACT|nr:5-oxoprolinase subunit PxpA [Botrimarina colliarenosi]TWU00298.1 LamB/YcsF family protein [Botrimarina colliarenosi]
MPTIDLNADVGEGAGNDAELIPLVTSANIACGGHAGDALTMAAAVRWAIDHGVAIGAHPGHEDREHFGRQEIAITPDALRRLLFAQVDRLHSVAAGLGGEVRYVKLHGALYHQTGRDAALAAAVVAFVHDYHTPLALLGQAGTALQEAADRADVAYFAEAFADRAYLDDGTLAPRSLPGAMLASESAVVAQAGRLARDGVAVSMSGKEIAIRCDSLCLHGDGANAVELTRAVRAALEAEGITLRAFSV